MARTFWILGLPQLRGTSVWTILVGTARKIAEYKLTYEVGNFSLLDKLVKLCICSQHRVFPLPCSYFFFLLGMEIFRGVCTTSSSDRFLLLQ